MGANAIGLIDGPTGTFQAGEAIAVFLRAKLASTGKVTIQDNTAIGDMIAQQPVASDEYGTFRFANASGTQIGVASETIAAGDAVYTATAGRVSKTATNNVLIGKALSAASAGEPVTYLIEP